MILIVAVLAANAFVIFLLIYALDVSREQKEQEVRTTLGNVALLLDHNITEIVDKIDLSLRETVDSLEREVRITGNIDDQVGEALMADRRAWISGLANLRVIDASGTLRYGPPGVVSGDKFVFADSGFFLTHRSQRDSGMIVTDPAIGLVNHIWLISFSRRYNGADGGFAGVVVADVSVSDLEHLLSQLDLGPHGVASLRSESGALIARYPVESDPSRLTGTKAISGELAAIFASGVPLQTFRAVQAETGAERIQTYRRLSRASMHLVIGMGGDDYLAQWRADVRKAIAVAVIFLVVTAASAWLLWRSFLLTEKSSERSRRLSNLYAALSQCNQAIVHCKNEAELFPMICRDAVRYGGMMMAWIGLVDEASQRVIPVASFGDNVDYLKQISISVDAADPFGRGSSGIAIRRNGPYWCQDFLRDPALAPWHEIGRKNGYAALASLPLTRNGVPIGCLTLYSGEVNAFDDDAQRLVVEMEQDISFALDNFAREAERRKAEEKINELAFFDQLTGLPNRTLLVDRLKQTMAASSRSDCYGALLFIDLDNFKTLNDTLGHDMGDLLLKQVAERLSACVRTGDTVARFGGDEFVLVLPSLTAIEANAAARVEVVGGKVLAALNQKYQLHDVAYRCTPSIGVTLFRGFHTSVDDLLKQADIAMYKSKTAGRNTIRFFDLAMESAVMERASLETGLRDAVLQEQFQLHYQALVVGDGLVSGAEALVRWLHPQKGLVPPAEFIPLAEETGLILPLGDWVLETACAQLAQWATRPEMADLTVAVNVSVHQFRQSDFVDRVLSVVNRTGADPRRLKLELTESLLAVNLQDIIEKMVALKSRGVGFSLDDFGTGYSSLSYLKRLPLEQLKIDQSFVRDVLNDPNDAAIARTIVTLAQSLGLGVIAEGVETEGQRDFLAQLGCHAYQGYFFSRPLPLEGFERFAAGSMATAVGPELLATDAAS